VGRVTKKRLHKTEPAYVTASKRGCDFLELRCTCDDREEIRISMSTTAMATLGCMMAKVAAGVKQKNIKRN